MSPHTISQFGVCCFSPSKHDFTHTFVVASTHIRDDEFGGKVRANCGRGRVAGDDLENKGLYNVFFDPIFISKTAPHILLTVHQHLISSIHTHYRLKRHYLGIYMDGTTTAHMMADGGCCWCARLALCSVPSFGDRSG